MLKLIGKPVWIDIPKTADQRNWRTIKAKIGEKSKPPTGGKKKRNGLQILSDISKRSRFAGWWPEGEIQLIIMPIINAHQITVSPINSTENKDQEIMVPKVNISMSLSEIR